MDDDKTASLGFSLFTGIGPMRYSDLVGRFGSAKQAYLAKENELREALSPSLVDRFLSFRAKTSIDRIMEELREKEIGFVYRDEPGYPSLLKNITDPPIGIFYRGNIGGFNWNETKGIAVVGTRKPSVYGIKKTRELCTDLAKAGVAVISGMAYGIDTAAHETTIENGGQTIAVLGCGIDIVYPIENNDLYWSIIKNNGLVISEFPPGRRVDKGLFVSRNRIVSGLSVSVIVVEGSKRSGSLITARYALDQGREVMAFPGQAGNWVAEAPHILLKQGAILITGPDDVMEYLGVEKKKPKEEPMAPSPVFEALGKECLTLEEIAVRQKMDIVSVLRELTRLEMEGVVAQNDAGSWYITSKT